MKRNIALLTGGDSSEFEISLQTAQNIQNNLDKDKYNSYVVIIHGLDWYVKHEKGNFIIDRNNFSFSFNEEKIKFDFAYVAIHGDPGENGVLQGYLQLLRIPHSTCNVLSSALSFDKYTCNTYLKSFGIISANAIFLKTSEDLQSEVVVDKLGLPCFVKPNAGGSSFGISKVKKKTELVSAVKKAFSEGNEVIIEEFLDGLEVTCGLVKTKQKKMIFPVTEIIPKKEYFDYDAKYDPTMAEEITPARISEKLTKQIQELSLKIYDLLKCKGIVRMDYIIQNNEIYLLEVNAVPGMTINSLIPKAIKAANLELKEILTLIIEDSI